MIGPPFEPHPASADSIRTHAEGLAIYAGGSYRLAGEVRHAFATAQSGVSGVLVGPMLQAPTRFYHTSDELHLAVMYAAGCLALFADAVRAFDAGVADINAEWAAAANDDFGVAPISPDAARTRHGTDQTKLARVEADRTLAVDIARRELVADLRRRYHRLEGRLDDVAHDVAMRLRRGPTGDEVRTLVQDGAFRQLFDGLSRRVDRLVPPPIDDSNVLGQVHQGYCDPQGYSTCGYRTGEDPGFWATVEALSTGAWKIGKGTADVLLLDDVDAALDGSKLAMAMVPLDIIPVGKVVQGLKFVKDAVRLAHDGENVEDILKLAPGGGLFVHEGIEGGHTVARHVDLTDQQLVDRVLSGTREASTFTDQAVAESAISHVIAANHAKIETWLASGTRRQLRLTGTSHEVVGRYVDDATMTIRNVKHVLVVLRPSNALGLGYRIHTAYPKP